jgi:hypothetical protein
MAQELNANVATMEFDGLITDITPKTIVGGGVVGKGEASLKRGTILSKGEDGKLAVMAASGNPDCILADDLEVSAAEDANAVVYTAGCFDPDKCIVADGYTLTEADRDVLRTKNIYFKSPEEA